MPSITINKMALLMSIHALILLFVSVNSFAQTYDFNSQQDYVIKSQQQDEETLRMQLQLAQMAKLKKQNNETKESGGSAGTGSVGTPLLLVLTLLSFRKKRKNWRKTHAL